MTLTKLTTKPVSFKFSTVPGYFLQDEPTTDPQTFDYVSSSTLNVDDILGQNY